jgi:hypothetical protein
MPLPSTFRARWCKVGGNPGGSSIEPKVAAELREQLQVNFKEKVDKSENDI